jgi:hypothetical protein
MDYFLSEVLGFVVFLAPLLLVMGVSTTLALLAFCWLSKGRSVTDLSAENLSLVGMRYIEANPR